MLNALAKRRLTKLADFMDALPKKAAKHFAMLTWVNHDGAHEHFERGSVLDQDDLMTCGTTACALGWATTIPAFKKAGLGMKWNGSTFSNEVFLKEKRAKCYDVFAIATEFFGIEHHQALYLFRDIRANTPKQWATNARKYMKTGTPSP